MSESEFLLFPTPVLAVKGAICFTCLRAASRLNRCSGCKRVLLVGAMHQRYLADMYNHSYCSQKCQKEDWGKGHKQLCPVLVEINGVDRPCDHRTWSEYRHDLVSYSFSFFIMAFKIPKIFIMLTNWDSWRKQKLGHRCSLYCQ